MMQERALVFCTAQSINSGDYSNIVRQQANNECHRLNVKKEPCCTLVLFISSFPSSVNHFFTIPALQAVDSISILSGKRAVHC